MAMEWYSISVKNVEKGTVPFSTFLLAVDYYPAVGGQVEWTVIVYLANKVVSLAL